MKFSLILILFVSISLSTFAQKVWSLNECINYAYENNLSIQKQKVDVASSSNSAEQARYNFLPDLNAGASYSFQTGRYFDNNKGEIATENSNSNSIGINASTQLYNGMRRMYELRYYEANKLLSKSELQKTKNDISITIATAYLDILYNKELLSLEEDQLALIKQQVAKTYSLVEAGSSAKGELLEIRAQEANEQLSLTRAKNTLELAFLNLVQAMDLDSTAGFDIVTPDILLSLENEARNIETLYTESLLKMPQIQSAELGISMSELQTDISRSYYQPSLSASYNYGTSYSSALSLPTDPTQDYSVVDQWNDNRGGSLSLNLSIPIFNRFQTRTQVAQSKLQTKQSQIQLDETKLALYKEIQQALLDLKSYKDSYLAAQEAVKFNAEAFEYTEQKLEVGLIDVIEYNTAKNNLRSAEVSLLQAKYQYVFQQKLLDFYTGNPITL
jgi:outer membrane protein